MQIDYLVQLPRCAYVVEIKRKRTIGKSIEDELQQKIDRLALPRNRSVKTVLVYEGELDPAVEEDGFFDAVVSADGFSAAAVKRQIAIYCGTLDAWCGCVYK